MSLRERAAWERPEAPYDQYREEDALCLAEGPPEDELNDVGHPVDCSCPTCLPEAHDEAEKALKRSAA